MIVDDKGVPLKVGQSIRFVAVWPPYIPVRLGSQSGTVTKVDTRGITYEMADEMPPRLRRCPKRVVEVCVQVKG